MKAENKNLSKALSIVGNAIVPKSYIPTYSSICMIGEPGDEANLTLIACNGDVQISTLCDASIGNDFRHVVHFETLKNLIKDLPAISETEINIKNKKLKVRSDNKNYNLPTMPAEDFIELDRGQDKLHKIEREDLIKCISRVLFAVSKDKGAGIRSGVHIYTGKDFVKEEDKEIEKNFLYFDSSDGYRISHCRMQVPDKLNVNVVVPTKTFELVSKLMPVKNEGTDAVEEDNLTHLDMSINDNTIVFQSYKTTIISRLIAGEYPNVLKLLPKTFSLTLNNLELSELAKAVKRVNLFSSEDRIYFKIVPKVKQTPAHLLITASSEIRGDGSEKIWLDDVKVKKEFKITFKASNLLDALKASTTKYDNLNFSSETGPIVLGGFKRFSFFVPYRL